MKAKTLIIALLVIVNLALLAGLMLTLGSRGTGINGTAFAQPVPGSPRYLMVTGRFRESDQALYVVNLESRMMAVFTFDQAKKRLSYQGRRSLQ